MVLIRRVIFSDHHLHPDAQLLRAPLEGVSEEKNLSFLPSDLRRVHPALNILCVYTIDQAWNIPLWVNLLCNSAYFLLIVAGATIIAYYLMRLLFEHIYQQRQQQIFAGIFLFLYLIFFALILYNLRSGIIFYFDENRIYCRGPLINFAYGIMGIHLAILICITLRNLKRFSLPMRRVMRILPPIILPLSAY